MVLAVFPGSRQQSIKGNENHDYGDPRENYTKDNDVHKRPKDLPAHPRAHRDSQSGKERVAEGFDSRTGSVIDGYGNRDPLRDIVDGDGADNGDCHAGILQG